MIRNVQLEQTNLTVCSRGRLVERCWELKKEALISVGQQEREICSLEQFRVTFMEVVWFSNLAVGLSEKSNGRIFVFVMLCNRKKGCSQRSLLVGGRGWGHLG